MGPVRHRGLSAIEIKRLVINLLVEIFQRKNGEVRGDLLEFIRHQPRCFVHLRTVNAFDPRLCDVHLLSLLPEQKCPSVER